MAIPKQPLERRETMFSTEKLKVTPEALAQCEKRFKWLINFLICRYHFIHTVLGTMRKSPKEGFGTMGVMVRGGRMDLIYDPAWMALLEDGEAVYIFYHEVLHVVFHHCTARQPNNKDQLWGIAIDLAVNELIEEVLPDICKRPKGKDGKLCGCFVSEYKKEKEYKDIEDKKSAEWYYDYLRRKQKENGGKGKGDGDGEPVYVQMDDHSGHEEDNIAEEKVRALVRDINVKNQWGSMTAGEKELIMAAQIRKINWRNLIRTWFGNIAWKDRQETRKRPNRRTGYAFPGYKKTYVDRWLVATDNSGSCFSEEVLGKWLGVLNQLSEVLPIDVVQFDAGITAMPKPFDRKKTKFDFTGSGGTDFQPVINLVDERKYRGVMILTDGCASPPSKPKRAKVLWVLPAGNTPPVEWGDRVFIDKNNV
jgi:predicted metal-dependent peptidase